MKGNQIGLVLGTLLLLATAICFFLLWNNLRASSQAENITNNYPVVSIKDKKKNVEDLLLGKTNLSQMPIPAPTADSVGRDNPFASY